MEITVLDFSIALSAFSGILFGLLLSVFLFSKKEGRKTAHMLLGLLLLIASLALINNLILLIGLPAQFNQLYFLPLDFTLSIGPLLYFYFRFKLKQSYRFKRLDIVHFVIPLAQALISLWVGFSSVSYKYQVWQNGIMERVFLIDNLLFPILLGYYVFASYRLLKERKSEAGFWDLQLFVWLERFLSVLVIIIVFRCSFMLLEFSLNDPPEFLEYVHFLVLLTLMIWLSLKAWEQYFPEFIYSANRQLVPKPETVWPSKEVSDFKKKTKELFEDDSIFTNPDLNLAMLGEVYGLSQRKVSEMLRKEFNQSPNDFVNSYRINYVLKALEEGKHESLTLLSIAFEAGFSSKSTFYRTFKRKTQFTPSEYIARIY